MSHKYDFYQKRSRYQFCEIPNNEEGWNTIKLMKKALNSDAYTLRVKGQYLDSKKYNWREHTRGAPIYASTHLRVYIDEKKEITNG